MNEKSQTDNESPSYVWFAVEGVIYRFISPRGPYSNPDSILGAIGQRTEIAHLDDAEQAGDLAQLLNEAFTAGIEYEASERRRLARTTPVTP
jgi:hypothetical protein